MKGYEQENKFILPFKKPNFVNKAVKIRRISPVN